MPSTTTSSRQIGAIPCEFCGAMREPRIMTRDDGTPYEFNGKPMAFGWFECGCDGAEHARKAREEVESIGRAEEKKSRLLGALQHAGIPPRYIDASHPWAQKLAEQAAEGQGFYICGPNGTLKTTLAMSAGRHLVENGRKVFAVASYDLMDAMRSRSSEERQIFERAAKCEVLILDDLGKEASTTAYAAERLFAIIDKRDKAMLPTIITTNYKLSEIAENITEGAVGVAIASRLASSCKQLAMEGEDRRLTSGKN